MDKKREYRIKKKDNKSKIRFGQRLKSASIFPEETFVNEQLRSNQIEPKKNDIIEETVYEKKQETEEVKEVELDDEYEQFDETYFEPIPYGKK